MSVAKAVLGAGVFALPWAFAQGGWMLTSGLNIGACCVALVTLRMVAQAREIVLWSKEKGRDASSGLENYVDIVRETIGSRGALLCEVLIVACCLGLCSAYLVFIASTVQSAFPGALASVKHQALVGLFVPVLTLLAFMERMRGVSAISLLGNISVGLGMTFVSFTAVKMPLSLKQIPASDISAFPRFWGTVAFLFFVHFSLPAVQAAMKEPRRFMRSASVAFLSCAWLANGFGLIGAAAFGRGVDSVVITEVAAGPLAAAVRLLLCANLLCTFPLVVRSAFHIFQSWFSSLGFPLGSVSKGLLRLAFVALSATCAIAVPSFGAILGYVGGISLSFISLVLPPLMLVSAKRSVSPALPIPFAEKASVVSCVCLGCLVCAVSAVLG